MKSNMVSFSTSNFTNNMNTVREFVPRIYWAQRNKTVRRDIEWHAFPILYSRYTRTTKGGYWNSKGEWGWLDKMIRDSRTKILFYTNIEKIEKRIKVIKDSLFQICNKRGIPFTAPTWKKRMHFNRF